MQGWFNIQKALNVKYSILTEAKTQKPLSIDADKSLQQNSATFHDKSSDETRKRKNVPQHNKGYI
jgi:ubiquitin-protein ligase